MLSGISFSLLMGKQFTITGQLVQNTFRCLGAALPVRIILCKLFNDFFNLCDAITEEFSGAADSAVFWKVKLQDSILFQKGWFHLH